MILSILLELWDEDREGRFYRIPGSDVWEWLQLHQHDYDEVDSLYLHHDICGGE